MAACLPPCPLVQRPTNTRTGWGLSLQASSLHCPVLHLVQFSTRRLHLQTLRAQEVERKRLVNWRRWFLEIENNFSGNFRLPFTIFHFFLWSHYHSECRERRNSRRVFSVWLLMGERTQVIRSPWNRPSIVHYCLHIWHSTKGNEQDYLVTWSVSCLYLTF